MLYVHTIGRIGKDCQVITGTHGTFIAFDIAVDDYSHGNNVTTWVRVRSKKENHIRLSEYLTKGRLVLIEGTLSASLWKDRNEDYQIQFSIAADALEFINTGKRRMFLCLLPICRRMIRTICRSDIIHVYRR